MSKSRVMYKENMSGLIKKDIEKLKELIEEMD